MSQRNPHVKNPINSGAWFNVQFYREQLELFTISIHCQVISRVANMWLCLFWKICCEMSVMAVLTISFRDCRLLLLLLWDPIKGEETDFLCSDKEAVVKVKYSHPIIIADSWSRLCFCCHCDMKWLFDLSQADFCKKCNKEQKSNFFIQFLESIIIFKRIYF